MIPTARHQQSFDHLSNDCAVALGMTLSALDIDFGHWMLKTFPGKHLSYWINTCLYLIYLLSKLLFV